jgi:putative ABC transport system ATP-binding protein
MAEALVSAQGLWRTYGQGDSAVHALAGVDLEVQQGEMVALVGSSGSGKSTLLGILGCLDRPSRGRCLLDGRDVGALDDDALSDLRSERLGFVFRGFHLLPGLPAIDNVMLPLLYDRRARYPDPRARARQMLERVGLGHRLEHRPEELSGGQQQRVAIARALVTSPRLLLADEPTGNLDTAHTMEILALLQELHQQGVTLIVVTHDGEVAERCGRAVLMRDGQIIADGPPGAVRP